MHKGFIETLTFLKHKSTKVRNFNRFLKCKSTKPKDRMTYKKHSVNTKHPDCKVCPFSPRSRGQKAEKSRGRGAKMSQGQTLGGQPPKGQSLRPVILFMIRPQAVNLPPWKIVIWFYRVIDMLKKIDGKMKDVVAGFLPCKELLPKLSEHWEELTANDYEDDDDAVDVNVPVGTFQVTLQITLRQRVCFLQFAIFRAVFPLEYLLC
jgi:hypothetical protein